MIDLYPPAGVTLAQIAAGDQDATLNLYAKDLAGWNHTFLLRLFPEMNGSWEPYSPGYNGNTTAQFIAAWRHVYTLFHHDGASNVQFIWNPDKALTHQPVSFAHLWPGSNYVDWVGLDVYMNGATVKTVMSARAATLLSVQKIRRFTKKPLIIPELGVSNTARKPHWISNSVRGLASLGVKAIVWFNEELSANTNWRFDSSSSALRRPGVPCRAHWWPGRVTTAAASRTTRPWSTRATGSSAGGSLTRPVTRSGRPDRRRSPRWCARTCAVRLPSRLRIVQPSGSTTYSSSPPAMNHGSIAMTSPSLQPHPSPRPAVVGHARRLMHLVPDPVATEVGVEPVAMRAADRRDRHRDVSDPSTDHRRAIPEASAVCAASISR